jgi:hypothetical protein
LLQLPHWQAFFDSISVNQERILELGRMADRGLEALTTLFLVIVVMSLNLIPEQPLHLLGAKSPRLVPPQWW